MDIIIDKNKRISQIQDEFQNRFPFLKIEFYSKAHALGQGSSNDNLIDASNTLEQAQTKDLDGVMKIQGIMTVAELEGAFAENFGLFAQVFRKAGKIWLQTIATDQWTLTEQNQKGMEKNEPIQADIVDSMDRLELE